MERASEYQRQETVVWGLMSWSRPETGWSDPWWRQKGGKDGIGSETVWGTPVTLLFEGTSQLWEQKVPKIASRFLA